MLIAVIIVLYCIALCMLSVLSLNRYVLISLFRKNANRRHESAPSIADADLPFVTIQLPIYNEYYVAERIIQSACDVDYPRDRFEVQVLDDSTDETLALTRRLVREHRARGIDIVHLHREKRTGYKSGALAYGLERARGEFVAVFDADFVIPRDFLRRAVPHFDSPKVGVVQARWTYLNEDYSVLTRATALGLDGQFIVEQPARFWGDLFLTFNGTAGLLRASCIRDAGGWQHDTITEDLDLSYRAQLNGWKIKYVWDLTCDSELPADIHGLKAQQFRWTKGTQETARKLLPALWKAKIPFWDKLQGTAHLLGNSSYPFLLLVGLLNPLMVIAAHQYDVRVLWPLSAYFLFSLFGTFAYYAEAERAGHARWIPRVLCFPLFLGASIGLSVNNAQAALEGLLGKKSPFIRTPKYHITGRGQSWKEKRYRSPIRWSTIGELVLGMYTLTAIGYAIWVKEYGALPFLVLFAGGYLLIALYSIRHHIVSGLGSRKLELAVDSGPALAAVPAEIPTAVASRKQRVGRGIAIVLIVAGSTGMLSCGGSEPALSRSDTILESEMPPRAPAGFDSLVLVASNQAASAPDAQSGPGGIFYYSPSGDSFEWYLSAQALEPGVRYRLELNVDDSLNYAAGSVMADENGRVLGHGDLHTFLDRYCVGAVGTPPVALSGEHTVGVRLKRDGSSPGESSAESSVTGPASRPLPCAGNGDGRFDYVLHEQKSVEFTGSANS
ncbi:MAG TPA: glycosyltransferase [Gemmatimonadaceae bacterium]|nr:glycosyltransferase [Gemmatimonadaceae bacterium]